MSRENPLHRARLVRGIDLAEVARRTCLSPHVVQKIDTGRFEELPRGVYARSYVRAFASAVELDPAAAIAAVGESLPPAEDPLPQLRDVASRTTPAWARALEGWVAPARAVVARWTSRSGEEADAPRTQTTESLDTAVLTGAAEPSALRLHLGAMAERIGSAARRGTGPLPTRYAALMTTFRDTAVWTERLTGSATRGIAAAVDGLVLVLLYGVLTWLTALTTGVPPLGVLHAAGLGVTVVWAVLVVQYVVVLGWIGGRTPGAWVVGHQRRTGPPQVAQLWLRTILTRAGLL